MMKLVVAVVILGVVVYADKLDNTYLPPNSARTAGGNGNILATPNRGGVAPKYGAPSGNGDDSGRYNGGSSGSFNQGQQGPGGFVQSPDAGAGILRFNNENFGDGTYRFEYETENKIFQEESGELKNQGTDSESSSVQGSYSYMGTDGIMYTVNYIADENGFQPIGDHLPTAPPVPEAIQRALDLLATQGDSDDESVGVSSNGGYQGKNGNGYQSNNGNGYQSNNGNGYQSNNGYQSSNGNGYQSSNGNGYQSSNGNGYQSSNGNGYQSSNGNGYQSNNGNGYQNNNANGYPSNNGNGYPSSNGYQSNQSNNGYQNRNSNGSQNRNGYQGNNGFQATAKTQQGGADRQSQIASRQYLAPNKPSFNSQSGYKY